jgi:hypothetical protein
MSTLDQIEAAAEKASRNAGAVLPEPRLFLKNS